MASLTLYPSGFSSYSLQTSPGTNGNVTAYGYGLSYPVTLYYKLTVNVVDLNYAFKYEYGNYTTSRYMASSSAWNSGLQTFSFPSRQLILKRSDHLQLVLRCWCDGAGAAQISISQNPYLGAILMGNITSCQIYTIAQASGVPNAIIAWGSSFPSYITFDLTPPTEVMRIKTQNSGIVSVSGRTLAQSAGGSDSALRINKNGTIYAIETGETWDPFASAFRVKTQAGVRSILKI